MPRDKGRHKRRIAPVDRGQRGRSAPVYMTLAEFHHVAAAAADRGVSTANILKCAGLARAGLLQGQGP